MERPRFRKYDATGGLITSELLLDTEQRFFSFVNGVWVASYEHLVLTPPPIRRTRINWRE